MTDNEVSRSTTRVRFPRISPRAYEHPADRGAMAGLRAIPGVSEVLKAVSGLFSERGERLLALASAIRVGEKQYPKIHQLVVECAETLDLDVVPKVYVERNPVANAMTVGIDEPFIVLTTGLVEALDTESLRFVIGHEMGHVLSGHAVLRTLLLRLLHLQMTIAFIPAGALALRAAIAALREWFRKAELTCDRAGLLCAQDPAAALRTHVYLAGGTDLTQIDIPSFLQQAKEYEEVDDIRDSIHKLRSVEGMSHPFAVVRAAQLQKWAASEEYRAILAGTYARRDDDNPSSAFTDDLRTAAKSYKDSFNESSDPLFKILNGVGDAMSDAAGKVFSKFGNRPDSNGNTTTDS
ncbi:Zn-dependent protease with chaperone function [Actinokineospora alba]|uniref:Zn-dependent protease with chaperone function n=1 Tax=Actinokineospora alba TaxID=504798 RepID=A0A1H0I9E7_9PSEU|nr:M48 family metallopeptidase [Actinokineospora alba]TDP64546.1 Zn-dependent protease with chaperone function [Actinokineospora alba]SDI87485.1 Zn-dependent protease with chaperone function [Actinokineospora alba]SDO28018.1 Zn-dependent protease with chaperone function [Actinokineospora alba]